jgi:hypothetical protein
MKLWINGYTEPPTDDWTWVTDAEQAIRLLEGQCVTEISLSYQLGASSNSGRSVAIWIEEAAQAGRLGPFAWSVTSPNKHDARELKSILRNADKGWTSCYVSR